ncbi:Cyanophycin synthetase [Sterolibacterium denitrificans]|uniref:Cyanophycin synthetase n=1 Tax=Sterolibacterium denitrificans TaxID=157592 RepID=A0A7Z7MVQ9_9PROT|nr:cyanophycin synthetase [Sterolibacterium denitrificans]SMB28581.1 Cyanophycin synthetase [Sterolibacterium denitrificans]
MEVSRIRALRGPNLWTRNTAIEAIVHLPESERDISRLPGFEARLRECFPQIGLLQPLQHGLPISLADALKAATLGLQAQAGCPVTFSRTTPTLEAGTYQVVAEYTEEEVGRLALTLAVALCQAALDGTAFDLDDALRQLRNLDEEVRLGPSTGAIVQAAVNRGIPYRRLTAGSLVQFGWGSQQRRIQAAETDGSSAIAEAIAQDKDLTKQLLDMAGIPVPRGRPVSTLEEAWQAALEIGLPVVVKPQDGNQGKGVTVNISRRDQLEAAFATAASISSEVLVERHLRGLDFRLLVVGNQLVAAARRDPPHVIGDGERSVQTLVDQVNSDPRRGDGHATALTRIPLDDIAHAKLAEQGLQATSIPPRGMPIILRDNANLSTGGTATDVTDDVHVDVAARVVEAARMVGLDVCGIDLVCDSLLHPIEEQGGGIVEVNAAPGLRMHLAPSYGKSRPVGEAIINLMYPDAGEARIPLVAVAGTNGKTTTVRLIAHLLGQQQLRVGMTTTDGIYIDGQRIDSDDCSGPRSARNVLLHPEVDAAVLETARGGVLREGLAFDRCDVAVVTNIGQGDHLGLAYIDTVEDLAVVKRVIVQNVAPRGMAVLNAADPVVADMAGICPGQVTYFARDPQHPVMSVHRAQGKRIVHVAGNDIVASEGEFEQRIPLAAVPLTDDGRIGFQVENVMASVAAAWALKLPWETILAGLASFAGGVASTPGRFNRFDYRGATLIADYGHNPDAIQALVQAIETLPVQSRMVVISGAGDRRDEDIRKQSEILGGAFDRVILYQDQCQRGRADGEVLAILRRGLHGAARTREIEEIHGEFLAIDRALSRLEAGDLCLILVDQVDAALAHIAARCASVAAG